MATGSAWNLSNPLKPLALFDPDSTRDIPFDWTLWLADVESAHASHEILVDTGLVCEQSTHNEGVIKARIAKDPLGPDLVINQKYFVTCRMIAANGEVDDMTVFLKITQL